MHVLSEYKKVYYLSDNTLTIFFSKSGEEENLREHSLSTRMLAAELSLPKASRGRFSAPGTLFTSQTNVSICFSPLGALPIMVLNGSFGHLWPGNIYFVAVFFSYVYTSVKLLHKYFHKLLNNPSLGHFKLCGDYINDFSIKLEK